MNPPVIISELPTELRREPLQLTHLPSIDDRHPDLPGWRAVACWWESDGRTVKGGITWRGEVMKSDNHWRWPDFVDVDQKFEMSVRAHETRG